MSDSVLTPASLWRRLAAMVYDSLLIFSILVIVGLTTLPFTNGLGISRDNIFIRLYIFSALFVFLGWFWTHGGQTLGMRAWRIQVQTASGAPLDWRRSTRRYLASVLSWLSLGIGFFWQWIDKDHRTWHDRLSGTRLVVLPKT